MQQDVEKNFQPGEVEKQYPSLAAEKPVTDHGVAIYTRHSPAEPELAPLVSRNPNQSETPEHDLSCPSEASGTGRVSQTDSDTLSADRKITSPSRQLSSPLTHGHPEPCHSSETLSPASDTTSLLDSCKGLTSQGTR